MRDNYKKTKENIFKKYKNYDAIPDVNGVDFQSKMNSLPIV